MKLVLFAAKLYYYKSGYLLQGISCVFVIVFGIVMKEMFLLDNMQKFGRAMIRG